MSERLSDLMMRIMNGLSPRSIRRVRVVLPSSAPVDPEPLLAGMDWLRSLGLEVIAPQRRREGSLRFLAGSDEERARELVEALADPDCDAVWCGRGGTGSLRTLQALDRRTGAGVLGSGGLGIQRALPLIGLSDATALLLARSTASPPGFAIHGPVVTQLSRLDEPSAGAVRAWLRRPDQLPSLRADPHQNWVSGVGEGRLVAGNLSLLASCAGTPEALGGGEPFVLVIEEIGEPAYRIDRLMAQLWRSGGFEGIRALCFGAFMDCRPPGEVEECLGTWAKTLGVPACGIFPVGHGGAAFPLALGLRYRMSADEGLLIPLEGVGQGLQGSSTPTRGEG